MPDIDRSPRERVYEEMHGHTCPNCKRYYNCLCTKQPEKHDLVCRDCEHAEYNPAVHGGKGMKKEA